jgi:hypothetical protein
VQLGRIEDQRGGKNDGSVLVLDGGVAVVVADFAEVESPTGVDFEKQRVWGHDTNVREMRQRRNLHNTVTVALP